MTDEEKLFEMVERCVADAVIALENDRPLLPFAKLLAQNGTVRDLACESVEEKQCYEHLLERLKGEVKMEDVDAVALVARVTIPEQYSAPSPQGIRIHVEEKAQAHKKISARLLYVPYDLFAADGEAKRSVMLHNPIAIGMPMEVYGS
ncbi:hypothetical protein LOH54_05850 [Sulfurimonas sp. HSL-3221]|uniref:hypothetical protein n=1 Tax=Thiomicrolovo TaxID=3451667 RepID=UPI001E53F4F6|nr:hypothetical protein [Sulfurimonas sp. HSL-3221]UFS63654.1 hypothetical protein LOH54_05850 [Sulfurimonas sp. HSL-3221]